MTTGTWVLIIVGLVFMVWFNLHRTRPLRQRVREYRHERASYVENLKLKMYDQQNLLDQNYVQRLVTTRHKEILTTHREQWVGELKEVLDYPGLVPYLTNREPDVLRWLQARIECVHLAERAALDMVPDYTAKHTEAASLPAPPHRKRTVEEVRASMVQRERTKIGDETAMAYVALEQIDELKDVEKAKIKEIVARDDLTEEEKQERIEGVRAMTQQRFTMLLEGTRDVQNHETDTPPPAVILGQP